MREFQEFKDSELQLAQLAKELKEGTFVYHMNKAIAAHERGDAKKKQMHLDNAKTARYSMKSTEIAKHKDLLDKYSQMREEVGLPEESELSEGTLMVSRHRSYARPGQGPEAHPITKDHGEASDGSRVYSVKQPNGFHGVLAVKGDTVVGSSHKNLSKDEAHKMGDHYVKHGTVGIGVGNHWSVGSGIHGKVVKEEAELDEAENVSHKDYASAKKRADAFTRQAKKTDSIEDHRKAESAHVVAQFAAKREGNSAALEKHKAQQMVHFKRHNELYSASQISTKGTPLSSRGHMLGAVRRDLSNVKEELELDEAIKGWKHAHSDIAKARAAASSASNNVKLVRLKKDGKESGMHDATKTFKSEDEARAHHANMVKLNPGKNIAHNLYVGGEHKEVLKEQSDRKLTYSQFVDSLQEAGAYQKDMDEKKPVYAQGVKGMKSKPFTKKFKTMDHFNKWADSEKSGDHEVHRVYQEEIEQILASDEFAALDEESKRAILARLAHIIEGASHDSKTRYEYSNDKKSRCYENRATITFSAFLAKLEEAKKYMKEEDEEDEERDDKRADKKSDRNGRKYPVKMHDGDDDGKNLGEESELDEAGAFSYGAKSPRKGSVAYNAMMKRKEQEKNKAPIEPKDQMVGVAKRVSEDVELDEGQTVKTKTGVIHKGSYGSEYDGNEKKKEAPAVKRGRGRPKKDSDESGSTKKYTFHDLLNRLSR